MGILKIEEEEEIRFDVYRGWKWWHHTGRRALLDGLGWYGEFVDDDGNVEYFN